MREFYAKTNNRRSQWIDKINSISNHLTNKVMFGKLLKQGGLAKNVWQERWCIAAGRWLDYFDDAKDNQAKGTIGKHIILLLIHSFIFSLINRLFD